MYNSSSHHGIKEFVITSTRLPAPFLNKNTSILFVRCSHKQDSRRSLGRLGISKSKTDEWMKRFGMRVGTQSLCDRETWSSSLEEAEGGGWLNQIRALWEPLCGVTPEPKRDDSTLETWSRPPPPTVWLSVYSWLWMSHLTFYYWRRSRFCPTAFVLRSQRSPRPHARADVGWIPPSGELLFSDGDVKHSHIVAIMTTGDALW